MLAKQDFGGYHLYTLSNGILDLSVTDLGATVTSLRFQGRETVLGYATAAEYLTKDAYLGALIGRYANRIGGAAFSLGGRRYTLPANEGSNQLHGGPDAFDKRRWSLGADEDALAFSLDSLDGDNGFPGNLTATIRYTLEGDTLRMDYEAVSDGDTVYAPTSHMYFDLSGRGQILDAGLQINASHVLEVDGELIPTGQLLPAEGAFDFHALRPVAANYDHCFVLDGEDCCVMEDGGIRMEVRTDFPAVQIYTGAFLPAPHGANGGLAIEPEYFPDSPNRPAFPSTLLRAGERFHRWATYRFSQT